MRCHTASRPLRVCCVLLYTSAPCWFGPRCLLSPNQHDGSANTSKSAWSCESLPCSAAPALVRRGRYKGPAQHICGGVVLLSPGDALSSSPANTTLNTHAILLGASSLTSAGVRRWRFYVLVHKQCNFAAVILSPAHDSSHEPHGGRKIQKMAELNEMVI